MDLFSILDDLFPILFDAQLIVFVGVLVIWAKYETVIRWVRRARRWAVRTIRRIRRGRGRIICTDGNIAGWIAPAMSAEEVVAVCNSLR